MLSREELKTIYNMVKDTQFEDKESEKVKTKLSLLVEMVDYQDEVQSNMAKIQDKIVALDKGDEDGKED